MGALQLTYEPKFKIVHRTHELMRSHEAKSVQLWLSIDPLSEQYNYQSHYNFAENKVISHRELEGLEGVWFGALLSQSSKPSIVETYLKPEIIESGVKTGENTGKFSETQLQNFSRGRSTESEQLTKNGLDKNTETITRVDPKTGKEGRTIPDAIKKDGGTVEIKDVKNQSLTRQLRLQKAESESKGVKPELIINKDAKLSEPLKNSGFEIKTYQNNTAIDNTAVEKPKVLQPSQAKKEEECKSCI